MKTPVMTSKSGGKAPLCKVCGDESSGFHYGVDSCEGCKGFFRRCITQGMNHKCANEEKCDITPFTRNSCQYCRLKKCFEVGMSREASRLGRRPKRLKEVGGDGGSSSRSHTANLPIAPYPTPQELYRLRMAELQKLLQANGTFKAELMQAFLSAAKASFQEHSKSSSVSSGQSGNKGQSAQQTVQQLVDVAMLGNINQLFDSGANKMQAISASSTPSCSTDSIGGAGAKAAGGGGGGGSLPPSDSPSSLHSPSDSFVELSNMTALDNFLFDQQLPGTPGSGQQNSAEASPDLSHLQSLNSPLNLNNINLDVASPLSDLDLGSPLMLPTASPVFNSSSNYNEPASHAQINGSMHAGATSSVCMVRQSQQQYQKQQAPLPANLNTFQIKTEPQPASPDYTVLSPLFADANSNEANDVAAIMEEVRQTPSDTRRLLIQQVTDAVIEAHFATCINTYKNVEEANKKLMSQKDVTGLPDMSRLSLCASSMWQQFISSMVPEITKVVKFCKKLPGFSEIDQDDQIRLIKQGSFEILVARFSILVDFESQEMLDPTHSMRSPRKVIRAMPMGEFLDEFFYMAAKFNPLRLTDAEIGLFTSVLIISPGRKGLANKRAVSKIQELYLQALYYLMKHNSPDGDSKFMKLMSLIPLFQRINDEHFKALNNIRMKSPEEFERQFPELHREIYDGNI